MKKYLVRNVRLYFAYTFLSRCVFDRGIFILFLLHRGFSNAEIGVLQAALFWANVLGEIPTGLFGDRFGRKASVCIGLALLIVNALGMILFTSFTPFFILFIIHGLSFAFVSGSDQAHFYDTLKALGREPDFVKLENRLRALGSVTLGIAMVLGGYLQLISWEAVYVAYAAIMGFALISCFFWKEPSAHSDIEDDDVPSGHLRTFFASRTGKVMLLFIGAMALFEAALTPYFVYAQNLFGDYGVKAEHIGIIFAVVEFSSGLVYLMATRVVERFRLKPLLLAVMLGSGILLMFNAIYSLPLALFLFYTVMLLPDVVAAAANNYFHERIPSGIRASSVSVQSFSESLLIGVAYISYGSLFSTLGVNQVLAATGILPVLAAVVLTIHFTRARFIEEVVDDHATRQDKIIA